VLSWVEPACMAVTNMSLYDAETQAWTEIAKKRRPSPALAVAAACQTGRRTCSSSQSGRRWGPPMLATDDAIAMTELAMMPTAARTTAMTVAACTACRRLMRGAR
jgi:hypothetical protein